MSKNQILFLEDVYQKNIPPFTAVMMSAQEACFINSQAKDGFIELHEKPTTIAIQKLKNGALEIIKEDELEEEDSI